MDSVGGANLCVAEAFRIRSSTEYQNCDRLRRKFGATYLAEAPIGSAESSAIHMLVGMWNSLASHVIAGNLDRSIFFSTNPVGLAWETLKPAVEILRARHGAEFALPLETLSQEYEAWLNSNEGSLFRTRAAQVAVAQFSQDPPN